MKIPVLYGKSDQIEKDAGVNVVYDNGDENYLPPYVHACVDFEPIPGGGDEGDEDMFIVHETEGTLDKTFAEIKTALRSGKIPVIVTEYAGSVFVYYCTLAGLILETDYVVDFVTETLTYDGVEILRYKTDVEDGYPTIDSP